MKFYTSVYSYMLQVCEKFKRERNYFFCPGGVRDLFGEANRSMLKSIERSQLLNYRVGTALHFILAMSLWQCFGPQCYRGGNWGLEKQVVCSSSHNWWEPQVSNPHLLTLRPVPFPLCPNCTPSTRKRTRSCVLNFYHLHSDKLSKVTVFHFCC